MESAFRENEYKLAVPQPRIEFYKRSLSYSGSVVALYSEPEEIAESLNSFFVESIISLNKNVEECDHSKFLFHQD